MPERESNSSYSARVDTFPSASSTRPTLLLISEHSFKIFEEELGQKLNFRARRSDYDYNTLHFCASNINMSTKAHFFKYPPKITQKWISGII